MLSENTEHQSHLPVIWPLPGVVKQQIHIESDARRMERYGERSVWPCYNEGERISRLREKAGWVKGGRRYRKSLGIRPSRALLNSKSSISVELKAQQRLSRSFKGEET